MVQGSFINSGKNISFDPETNVLTCQLANVHGVYIQNRKKIQLDLEYHNNNGVLTPSNYTNCYVISIGNQLGNCLRIIVSGLILADHYHKHPFLLLHNIWDKEKTVLSQLFDQYILDQEVDFERLDYNDVVSYDEFYGTNYDLIHEGRLKSAPSGSFGITSTIYSVLPEDMSEEDYIRKKIKIYQSLPLPREFAQSIQHFIKIAKLPSRVGIHIRYSDNLNDTCKNKHNFNTSLAVFESKMDSIQEPLFVCSDSAAVLDRLRSRSNVVFANKCKDPHYQAFYEMCLLSHCKSMVGTQSSTFSYEAAFLKGSKIELYIDQAWKLYDLEQYR
jgi:hypothetical protein